MQPYATIKTFAPRARFSNEDGVSMRIPLTLITVMTSFVLPSQSRASSTTYPQPLPPLTQFSTTVNEQVSTTGCQNPVSNGSSSTSSPANYYIPLPLGGESGGTGALGGLPQFLADSTPFPTVTLPAALGTILTLVNGVSEYQGAATPVVQTLQFSSPTGTQTRTYTLAVSGSVVREALVSVYTYAGNTDSGSEQGNSTNNLASTYNIATGIQTFTWTGNLTSTSSDTQSGCVTVQNDQQSGSGTASYYAKSPITIVSSLPSGMENVAYPSTATVSGGVAPTVTITGLPTGLTADASGNISGTPATGTAAKSPYSLVISALDSKGDSAGPVTLSLTISSPCPTAMDVPLASGSYSEEGNRTSTTASPNVTRTVLTGPGCSAPTPLVVTTKYLDSGTAGEAYSGTLSASGGTPPYSWTISQGALPAGLNLSPATGIISGTPSLNSSFPSELTVQVTDANGNVASQTFFIAIVRAGKQFLSDATKEGCQEHAITDGTYATSFTLLATAAALNPVTEEVVPFFEFLAEEFIADSAYWTELAADAPDPNYTIVAPPIFGKVPALPISGLSMGEMGEMVALDSLMTSLDQEIAYENAMVKAIDRAQGAFAAGDKAWEDRQLHAAALYSFMLSNLLTSQPALGSNLEAALQRGGFPTIQISQQMLTELESTTATEGLSAAFVRGLTELGADPAVIGEAQKLLSFPSAMPGAFPDMLGEPAFGQSSLALGTSLQSFAASEAAASYQFGGFLRPSPDMTVNSGERVPIRFQLKTAEDSVISTASATLEVFLLSANGVAQPVLFTSGNGKNQDGLFRYDQEDQQYHYSFRLKDAASGTYLLHVVLDDLSTHDIQVSVVPGHDGDQGEDETVSR
jgi:hypothetical protein